MWPGRHRIPEAVIGASRRGMTTLASPTTNGARMLAQFARSTNAEHEML